MADVTPDDVQAAYDRVADEYVARIADELRHKPLDRQLLDRFAEAVRPIGPACDLGCGPGHVAGYLHARGLPVAGVDMSPAMVEAARRLHPEITFSQGDMRSLSIEDDSLGGIAAFYSIIHLPPPEIEPALIEMRRVLRPGGLLLLVFHIGDSVVHLDEWWGRDVSIDFHFLPTADVTSRLVRAGFEVRDVIEREPYPDVEYRSRRAYVLARRPRLGAAQGEAGQNSAVG